MQPRTMALILGVLFVFGAVAAIMTRFMPDPLTDFDFVVIGSVATLVSLLALFFGVVGFRNDGGNPFFKRRKKPRG